MIYSLESRRRRARLARRQLSGIVAILLSGLVVGAVATPTCNTALWRRDSRLATSPRRLAYVVVHNAPTGMLLTLPLGEQLPPGLVPFATIYIVSARQRCDGLWTGSRVVYEHELDIIAPSGVPPGVSVLDVRRAAVDALTREGKLSDVVLAGLLVTGDGVTVRWRPWGLAGEVTGWVLLLATALSGVQWLRARRVLGRWEAFTAGGTAACPECGHDARQLQRCPECGTPLVGRPSGEP